MRCRLIPSSKTILYLNSSANTVHLRKVNRSTKSRMAKKSAFFLIMALVLSLNPCQANTLTIFEQEPLHIQTRDGRSYDFTVEIAETPEQLRQGLMFRKHLAKEKGMLFLPDKERFMVMWMKNTLIPLDMVFIDRNGIIVDIAASTVPESLTQISPPMPVFAVLEINAGLTKEYGIVPGDKILHRAFVNAQLR